MEDVFYYNKATNESLTYMDLIAHVNKTKEVKNTGVFQSTKAFFLNFICGICNNTNLVLVDVDAEDSINKTKQVAINPKQFKDLAALLEAVKISTTRITIFTSGTTGQPKKVEHTIQNLTREVRTGEKFKKNIWAFAYNPTHMAGLQVFFQAFFNENPIVDIFNYEKKEVLNLLKETQITHLSATPTFYRLLFPADMKFDHVTNVSFGGEKSNKKLHTNIKSIFPNAKILNIYASTEAGTLFSSSGENFKITSKNKALIKFENNELFIHTSLLGKREDEEFKGDWYATGDLVEQIDDLTFKFLSRKNEMINVGGYKVNPLEVEQILDSIEGINKAFVFGKPNPVLGNILFAKIVLDNPDLTEPEIKAELRAAIKPYKVPRKIEFVKELATTRTGKLKRV